MAAANKAAPFLLLLVGLAAAGGGSGSRLSNRVGCSGGGHRDMDFVLVPRRRGDAGSGVVMRYLSLCRSEVVVPARLQRSATSGSSSLPGDFNGIVAFFRFAGIPACWHGEAEDDDFPPAVASARTKVSPARVGRGGSGGEARPHLTPVSSVVRGPRDRAVIFTLFGVRCNACC